MGLFKATIGELHWIAPRWAKRAGPGGLFGLALLVFAIIAAFYYLSSRPERTAIVAVAEAPGPTPIVDDELKPAPLRIDFRVRPGALDPAEMSDSVAPVDMIGKEISDGIRLTPEHPGVWRWASENRLQFHPDADWPAGTKFTVRFAETLFAPGVSLASSKTTFVTAPFTVELTEIRFYQDPRDDGERKVVATLTFSHPVNAASLADNLWLDMRQDDSTVSVPATDLPVEIEYDRLRRQAYVHSTPIELPRVESFATLNIDTGVIPAAGRSAITKALTGDVRIPDVSSFFRVQSSDALIVRNRRDDPEQTVTFSFTDRVNSEVFSKSVKVWLLPEYHVINGRRLKNWKTPREVTETELARSTRVEAVPNPTELDAAALQSFRIDTQESRYVYARIEPGLTSTGGFTMAEGYDTVLQVPRYPREAKIARDGAVLPLSGDHKLTFVTRGVAALRVEIGRVLEAQVAHLATQTRGDITNPHFNNYAFDQSNISERTTRYIDLLSRHPREAVFAHLDLSEFLQGGGFYFIEVQGWDAGRKRVVGVRDRRFVMLTDLGVLVKANVDQSQDVFVPSIARGTPISGARVQLLGRNGLAIRTGRTDARGHVHLASVKGLEREREPAVFLVSSGSDQMFLPYERRSRQLHLERYDTGGDYVTDEPNRLKAFLFTDRGLYRPGDTANLAIAVKREDFTPLPNVPVDLEIRDPRGSIVYRDRLTLPDGGFFDKQFLTDPASATGNYSATLFLVRTPDRPRRALGSVDFKVEEFQPDRMRIRAHVLGSKSSGWIAPGTIETRVNLDNLFGTPAAGRRVSGRWQLAPVSPQLSEFPDYVFGDPLRAPGITPKSVTGTLPKATTDEDGVAVVPLELTQYDHGIYRLTVFVEGFEAGGGRSVAARAGTILSPLNHLVGFKSDGNLSYIKRGGKRAIQLIAVDDDARQISLDTLRIQIAEQRFVSTLAQQADGTYAYQSVQKELPVSDAPFAIAADGSIFSLPTGAPGRFVAKIVDGTGQLLSQVPFVVAGAANLTGNLERNAELDLRLNGTDFAPGEEVEFEVTAPYAGAGLVTIERDKVYAFKWFQTSERASVHRITLPRDLEGNAYLNVAFVREIDSPEVFVSPLSYAVAPFSINRAARNIQIEIDTPKTVRPGRTLPVRYSTSRRSKIILYGVDEGILQVARYANPDPLTFFLGKKALQVSTFQVVDLLLPAFELLQSVSPGGGEGAALLGRNLNPFRRKSDAPVVFWSGILDAGTAARTFDYAIPDYFDGNLRVMAVAVSDAALGNGAASTVVRGPLILTPNVLSAVAPGDEFEVSVGIANNVENSGDGAAVDVHLSASEHLSIVGGASKSVAIAEGDEGRAIFRLRARQRLGAADLRFSASVGGDEVRRRASLSVRPAVPFMTTVETGHASTSPLPLPLPRQLYAEYASQSAAVSASPLILTEGLLDYLQFFPHQCVEQMVSRVFPQLGLAGIPDYQPDPAALREMFDALVRALRRRQHADGGFRYWISSVDSEAFATIYTMHFLTEARERGFSVPKDIDRNGQEFLRKLAAREVTDLASARLRAYAIYVLTRNAQVTTNYLTNLHEYLQRDHAKSWRSDLTAAYMAASYELLQQTDLGGNLIGRYEIGTGKDFVSDFDTRLGRDAQYLYLLARHFPTRAAKVGPAAIQALADPIFENRFNTLSSSYAVLALAAMTRASEATKPLPLLTIIGSAAGGDRVELSGPGRRYAVAAIPSGVDEVTANGGADDIYYSVSQAGYDQALPNDAVRAGLEIFREYLDDTEKPVASAIVGDELTVRLRIRSLGSFRSNVAVVDLLPGGFEVLIDSVRNDPGGWSSDYEDIREDRVVIYGGVSTRLTEFRYRVKVTSIGDFVVPAAYAGSMYDRSVHARTKPARFSVADTQ